MNTSNIDALAKAAEKASAEMQMQEANAASTGPHESPEDNAKGTEENKKDSIVDCHDYTRTVTGSPKLPSNAAAASSQEMVHADADVAMDTSADNTVAQQRPRSVSESASTSKRKPSFPDRLHAVLSNRSLVDIVDWLPSGKSFCILDRDKFTVKVLPMYFKETKFASFARRLKRWGFRRIYTTGQKQIVLCHDLFQRDRLDLGQMMTAGQQQQQEGHDDTKKKMVAENTSTITRNFRNVDVVPQEHTLQMMQPQHNASHHVRHGMYSNNASAAAAAFHPPPFPMNHMHDHQASIMRNGLYHPNNIAMMHHPALHNNPRPPPVPYMPEREAAVANEVTALEQEIQDCQEQLLILHRLRALREKRRVLS
eukprot:scaffold31765_cov64-Cyclotella_meneghiniana.AAC.2